MHCRQGVTCSVLSYHSEWVTSLGKPSWTTGAHTILFLQPFPEPLCPAQAEPCSFLIFYYNEADKAKKNSPWLSFSQGREAGKGPTDWERGASALNANRCTCDAENLASVHQCWIEYQRQFCVEQKRIALLFCQAHSELLCVPMWKDLVRSFIIIVQQQVEDPYW